MVDPPKKSDSKKVLKKKVVKKKVVKKKVVKKVVKKKVLKKKVLKQPGEADQPGGVAPAKKKKLKRVKKKAAGAGAGEAPPKKGSALSKIKKKRSKPVYVGDEPADTSPGSVPPGNTGGAGPGRPGSDAQSRNALAAAFGLDRSGGKAGPGAPAATLPGAALQPGAPAMTGAFQQVLRAEQQKEAQRRVGYTEETVPGMDEAEPGAPGHAPKEPGAGAGDVLRGVGGGVVRQTSLSREAEPSWNRPLAGAVEIIEDEKVDAPWALLGTYRDKGRHISCACWLAPDKIVTASNEDGTIKIYDTTQKKLVSTLQSHPGARVRAVSSVPNTSLLASGLLDGNVDVWNLTKGSMTGSLVGHHGAVTSLLGLHTVGAEPGVLVSGSSDNTVRAWDVPGHRVTSQSQCTDGVLSIAQLPDRRVASGCVDGSLLVWDVQGHRDLVMFDAHEKGVSSIAVLSETTIATASFEKTLKLWNVAQQRQVGAIPLPWVPSCLSNVYDPRAKKNILLAGCSNGTLCLIDYHRQQLLQQFQAHNDFVSAIIPVPEGRVVTTSTDGSTRLWKMRD